MNNFKVLIRSAVGEKFFEYFKDVLKGVEKNCIDLLGKPLHFSNYESHLADKLSVIKNQDYAIAVVRMEVSDEFSGSIYLCVSLCDAITFGGILMMIGDERLENKRKLLNYTQEEEDAFREVANVMTSAVDGTLRGLVDKKIHTKLAEVQRGDPDEFAKEDNKFFSDGEYVIITFSSTIAEYKKSKCILAVEKSLAEAIVGSSLDEESGTQPTAPTVSASTQTTSPEAEKPISEPEPSVTTEVSNPVIIVYDKNVEEFTILENVISDMNKKTLKIEELKETDKYIKEANIVGIVFDLTSRNNAELDYCKKLRLLPKFKKTPIFLCVSNPTKDIVYKAANSGISDIIVKPFTKEILFKKLKSHIN